jgi:plastocyanin
MTTALVCFALSLTGCKPDATLHKAERLDSSNTTQPAAAPVDTSSFGTVTGLVNFTGKPPARVAIDMSMDPACGLSAAANMSEPYIVTGGKLANVYVYIKSGAPASKAPAGTAPVVLDQQGCKYVPHVIALQQGGTVEFRNSDPTMHNIHTTPADGSTPTDISEGPGGTPKSQVFNAPETMLPVRCNNHPWMNAFLNVAPNPYFAVTGADGKFTLRLPPGTYTVAAVHEKLGEQDITLTVPARGTAKANFTYAAK